MECSALNKPSAYLPFRPTSAKDILCEALGLVGECIDTFMYSIYIYTHISTSTSPQVHSNYYLPFLEVLSAMSLEKPLRLDGEALVLCRGFDGVSGWVLDN